MPPDRAFDLLLPLAQWLYERGRYLAGLDTLASLAGPWGLGLHNEGAFAMLQGEAWAGLGALPAAMAWLEHAVACLQALADQDPSHAGWQADLALSCGKVSLALEAGSEEARALLERGLGILRGLQAESRLTATQLAWIAAFEQALRPEERPPWHRRLWAWLSRSR